jgi:hypothetical protein
MLACRACELICNEVGSTQVVVRRIGDALVDKRENLFPAVVGMQRSSLEFRNSISFPALARML